MKKEVKLGEKCRCKQQSIFWLNAFLRDNRTDKMVNPEKEKKNRFFIKGIQNLWRPRFGEAKFMIMNVPI